MENVTQARGIVRRVEEPGAAGGDVLLIFRRHRSGKEIFHCRVEPEGAFSPRLLERFREFVGYRVQTDAVSHRFSQRYEHYRGGHSFTLNYRLEVQVDAPQDLQTKLSRDPLGRLQRLVEELVGGAVSRQEWEEIETAPTEAGMRALSSVRHDLHGRIGATVAEALNERAREMGLLLLSLDVDCELDELGKAGPVADAEADADIARRNASYRAEVVEKKTSADLARVELEAQGPVDRLQVERQWFLDMASRSEVLATRVLEHFDQALGGVAGDIDDVSSLTTTVEELVRLQRSISGLVRGKSVAGGDAPTLLAESPGGALPALPEADGMTPCAEFLSEAMNHVSALGGDEAEKQSWLAYILRLTAAILDEGSESDEVDRLQEDFEARYKASVRSLRTDEQRRFFSNLHQPEHLRSRLLGEED